MAKPTIFYQNIIASGSLVDPGTESGFNKDDLIDLKAYKIWKSNTTTSPINIDRIGAAQNADYIALINHNLNAIGATVKILADNATPPTTERLAAFAPGEDTVTLRTFTAPGALTDWRIVITDPAPPFGAKPFIGELFLGMKTVLPEFLSPAFDPFFTDAEVAGARSEAGHYLGATIRGLTHRGTIQFGPAGIARADFTSTLNTFISTHARLKKPFLFVVDTDDVDFDTPYYLKVRDDAAIPRGAVGGAWSRMTLSLDVEEAYMEPVT